MGIVVTAVLIALAAAGIYVYRAFASAKKSTGEKQDGSADTEGVDALAPQPSPSSTAWYASLLDVINGLLGKIGIIGLTVDTTGTTAQQFMPFDKIEDSMICVSDVRGCKYYRMLIECNSINYYLKTNQERDSVDAQFMSAITGWNFPWGVYVQTRTLDNRAFVQQTRNDVSSVSLKYPSLAEYGEAYYSFIEEMMNSKKTHMLIKKKYIIVTCNEACTVEDLDDDDRQDWAFEKLVNRCQMIQDSLGKMGISSHICRNAEISSVIFQAFNKKDGGAADGIVSSDFLAGTVTGKDMPKDFDANSLPELIHEFVNQIDVCIAESPDASFDEKAKARRVQQKAEELLNILKE